MTPDLPLAPPWIDDLPHDARGFPVPAEAGWVGGAPVLSTVHMERKLALGLRRRCGVCGYPMPKETVVYRAFAQSDAAEIRLNQKDFAPEPAGPLHLSCVLYSAMACPFLREKTARMGKDNNFSPGAKRGSLAAVMGFEDYALLMYANPPPIGGDVPQPQFGYLRLVEDIPYRHGAELQERYAAAVHADEAVIDLSAARLHWTNEDAALEELVGPLQGDLQAIKQSAPMFAISVDGLPYVALEII